MKFFYLRSLIKYLNDKFAASFGGFFVKSFTLCPSMLPASEKSVDSGITTSAN